MDVPKEIATDELEEKKYFEYTSHWYFLTVHEDHPLWDLFKDPELFKQRLPKIVDGVWQLEKCHKCGRLLVQAVVKFDRAERWSKARELFKPAHVRRVVSQSRAIKYVQKEDTRVEGPWTFGLADRRTIRYVDNY
jgi:rRNA maturation protein Nop10